MALEYFRKHFICIFKQNFIQKNEHYLCILGNNNPETNTRNVLNITQETVYIIIFQGQISHFSFISFTFKIPFK